MDDEIFSYDSDQDNSMNQERHHTYTRETIEVIRLIRGNERLFYLIDLTHRSVNHYKELYRYTGFTTPSENSWEYAKFTDDEGDIYLKATLDLNTNGVSSKIHGYGDRETFEIRTPVDPGENILIRLYNIRNPREDRKRLVYQTTLRLDDEDNIEHVNTFFTILGLSPRVFNNWVHTPQSAHTAISTWGMMDKISNEIFPNFKGEIEWNKSTVEFTNQQDEKFKSYCYEFNRQLSGCEFQQYLTSGRFNIQIVHDVTRAIYHRNYYFIDEENHIIVLNKRDGMYDGENSESIKNFFTHWVTLQKKNEESRSKRQRIVRSRFQIHENSNYNNLRILDKITDNMISLFRSQ